MLYFTIPLTYFGHQWRLTSFHFIIVVQLVEEPAKAVTGVACTYTGVGSIVKIVVNCIPKQGTQRLRLQGVLERLQQSFCYGSTVRKIMYCYEGVLEIYQDTKSVILTLTTFSLEMYQYTEPVIIMLTNFWSMI
jgi:hypothetical protein